MMKSILPFLFLLTSPSAFSISNEIYPPDFGGLKYYDAAIKYGECMALIHKGNFTVKDSNPKLDDCRQFIDSYEANIANNYVDKFVASHSPILNTMSGQDVISKEKEVFNELKKLYKIKK